MLFFQFPFPIFTYIFIFRLRSRGEKGREGNMDDRYDVDVYEVGTVDWGCGFIRKGGVCK